MKPLFQLLIYQAWIPKPPLVSPFTLCPPVSLAANLPRCSQKDTYSLCVFSMVVIQTFLTPFYTTVRPSGLLTMTTLTNVWGPHRLGYVTEQPMRMLVHRGSYFAFCVFLCEVQKAFVQGHTMCRESRDSNPFQHPCLSWSSPGINNRIQIFQCEGQRHQTLPSLTFLAFDPSLSPPSSLSYYFLPKTTPLSGQFTPFDTNI